MLFNSYIFIFLFLPLALLGYYAFNYMKRNKIAKVFLIGMSLWFYGYFNKSYVLIIVGSISINYILSKYIGSIKREYIKRLILALGIGVNSALIFYFKYYNFFIDNINDVFRKSFELKNIIMPLGISFFTFQQISYLVDSYKGETEGYTFEEYTLFVSFFPQLIAGPIVMHSEIIPQFRNKNNWYLNTKNFSKGMYIFAYGLFKKVIIADTFAKAVNFGFETIQTLSSMEALIISFSYTFQLYFDFSGYCDMATGIGNMFNIELPQNFNSPYKAFSIVEFWNRWHISLTRFLKKYVYIPLGGSHKGKFRTYVNIMIVFLVSGLWHGANWTFILWGVLHGILNCLDRLFKKQWSRLNGITQWALTFMLVNSLWVIFRADNIISAKIFLGKLCSLSSFTIRDDLYNCYKLEEFLLFEKLPFFNFLSSHITGMHLWIFIFGAFFCVLNFQNSREKEFMPTVFNSIITVVCLVWSILSFAGISTFLYFDF